MKPVLYISKRSPYARRIRILLQEMGVEHDIEVLDVFQPPAWIFPVNPLGRVPALKLTTGECIVDSAQIFSYLKETHGEHPFFQTGGTRLASLLTYSGIATGIMEGVIQYFLETLRPEGQRSPDDLEEYTRLITRGLDYLESHFTGPWYTGDALRACDFDIGVALQYVEFRVDAKMLDRTPRLKAYFAKLSERESFRTTKPS